MEKRLSEATSEACRSGVVFTPMDVMPLSTPALAKIFPFTRKVGCPQASTSVASGNDRQISRTLARSLTLGDLRPGTASRRGRVVAVDRRDFAGTDFARAVPPGLF